MQGEQMTIETLEKAVGVFECPYDEADALRSMLIERGQEVYDLRALLREAVKAKRLTAAWRKRASAMLDVPRETPLPFPAGLNTAAWASWIDYRRERGLPRYRSMRMAQWLAGHKADEQTAIVDQSIRMNWSGLFELKGAINGQAGSSRYDRLGKEFEGRAASVLSMEPAAADVRDSLDGPVRAGTKSALDTRRR